MYFQRVVTFSWQQWRILIATYKICAIVVLFEPVSGHRKTETFGNVISTSFVDISLSGVLLKLSMRSLQ